jgi:hypothetical protein
LIFSTAIGFGIWSMRWNALTSEDVIWRKIKALAFAEKFVLIDHPESPFVEAFVKESLVSFENPPST